MMKQALLLKPLLTIFISLAFVSSIGSINQSNSYSLPIAVLKNNLIQSIPKAQTFSIDSNSSRRSFVHPTAVVSYANTTSVSFVDVECPTVATSTINVPDNLVITCLLYTSPSPRDS